MNQWLMHFLGIAGACFGVIGIGCWLGHLDRKRWERMAEEVRKRGGHKPPYPMPAPAPPKIYGEGPAE